MLKLLLGDYLYYYTHELSIVHDRFHHHKLIILTIFLCDHAVSMYPLAWCSPVKR